MQQNDVVLQTVDDLKKKGIIDAVARWHRLTLIHPELHAVQTQDQWNVWQQTHPETGYDYWYDRLVALQYHEPTHDAFEENALGRHHPTEQKLGQTIGNAFRQFGRKGPLTLEERKENIGNKWVSLTKKYKLDVYNEYPNDPKYTKIGTKEDFLQWRSSLPETVKKNIPVSAWSYKKYYEATSWRKLLKKYPTLHNITTEKQYKTWETVNTTKGRFTGKLRKPKVLPWQFSQNHRNDTSHVVTAVGSQLANLATDKFKPGTNATYSKSNRQLMMDKARTKRNQKLQKKTKKQKQQPQSAVPEKSVAPKPPITPTVPPPIDSEEETAFLQEVADAIAQNQQDETQAIAEEEEEQEREDQFADSISPVILRAPPLSVPFQSNMQEQESYDSEDSGSSQSSSSAGSSVRDFAKDQIKNQVKKGARKLANRFGSQAATQGATSAAASAGTGAAGAAAGAGGGAAVGAGGAAAGAGAIGGGTVLLIILAIIIILVIIIAIFMMIFGSQNDQQNNQPVPITLTKSGPDAVPNNSQIQYSLTVSYPADVISLDVVDPLPSNVKYLSSDGVYDQGNNTITWKIINPDPVPVTSTASQSAKLSNTLTLLVSPLSSDTYVFNTAHVANINEGTVVVPTGGGNVGPSSNNCAGILNPAYSLLGNSRIGFFHDIPVPNGQNFGDPQCTFSIDKMDSQIRQLDPNNLAAWHYIAVRESGAGGTDGPNAYLKASTSGGGAFGLFQMNGTGRAVDQATDKFDDGEVNWPLQISNAINYNNKHGGNFPLWGGRPPI